jgi:hypothetical protein
LFHFWKYILINRKTTPEIKDTTAENKQDIGLSKRETSKPTWERINGDTVITREEALIERDENACKKPPVIEKSEPAITTI